MNIEGLDDDGIEESSEPSNASYGSSRSAGNQDELFEPVKLLNETFNLPRDLCEDPAIFDEFFSIDTWNSIPEDVRNSLCSNLLPTFPENDEFEKKKTIQMLFKNELERFGQAPLKTFQANLEDGNYRPDIVKLSKSLKRAHEREQRYQECERISRLAKSLHNSRIELLKSAYSQPAGGISKLSRTISAAPKLASTAAANRAKKRYFQEIISISEEAGFNPLLSDDENYPEGPSPSFTNKQKMTLSGLLDGHMSPETELRIISTLDTSAGGDHEYLLQLANNMTPSDDHYRRMLQNHKKRKLVEPDHPELEIDDIKFKDVLNRAQLPTTSKKSTYMLKKEIKIKQEPGSNLTLNNLSQFNNHNVQHLQNTQNQGQIRVMKPQQKHQMMPKSKLACHINVQQRVLGGSNSETDEEDWIKANIIKVEPRNEANATTVEQPKVPEKIIKMVQVAKKRPNSSGMITVQSKKIALDPDFMKTIIVREPKSSNYQTQPATISDLQGVDMMQLPVDLDSSAKSAETHACYLSLIRDLFCATQDHRMKLDDLRKKVVQWLGNPITACNDWFHQSNNWLLLLTSAVQFLSGEFLEQPEDYVPYLEYKSTLAIYQWIGAGRDSDNHLLPLCNYWLSRRDDMGMKNFKLDLKTKCQVPICEREDFVQPERPISPPSTNCSSEWRVGRTSDYDRAYFQQQERKRYEHPHLSFTYKQHNYESVVGPVKGIYTQVPGVSKARDHNTLVADRPNFVTILALVRDATARLPNGEGTRADICELLKSSQYISPTAPEAVLQSIVSGALDRMHTETDPCVKYDTKRKMWIYLHRNRTEDEFEKIHLQQQGMTKQKKQPIFKKMKGSKSREDSDEISPTTSTSSRNSQQSSQSIPNLSLSPLSSKTNVVTKPAQIIVKTFPQRIITAQKTIPALASFENKNKMMQSSPPPLVTKMMPKKVISLQNNQMEPFDVEASLDAHTTPILVKSQHNVVDNKMPKLTLKNMKLAAPMKVNLIQSGHQSILINTSRAQSPSVATYKKIMGKPVIISHSQAPPLVSQSSPISSTGQTYIPYMSTSVALPNQSISTTVSGTFAPKLVKSTDKPVLQQKNFVRINTQGGKVSPMQPKLILTSAALQQKVIGAVSTGTKAPNNQMLSQQKQIFQSTLVQQQKNKSMAGTIQKMPALALSSNVTQSNPQILHSIKTLPGKSPTLVMKSQIVKSQANQDAAPPLVSVSNVTSNIGNVASTVPSLQREIPAKLIRPNQGGNIQVIASNVQTRTTTNQPLVAKVLTSSGQTQLISLDSLLQKPGTTFKLANAKPGQTGIIQLGNQGSGQITQYAVVSKGGKNMISVSPGMQRLVTTIANTANSTKTIETVATTSTSTNVVLNNPQQPGQQIKILQSSAPITTQQLMNAKLINVQGLSGKGIKTAGGIKMLSTQNYIANIGGKQMLITGKPPVTTGGTNQGIMLQTSGASNGSNTFILNSQGQPMKVQGNILTQGNFLNQTNPQTQTVMLGNQLVKVQSLSQIQQQQIQKVANLNSSNALTSNTATMTGSNTLVLQSGQTIKVQQPNQTGIRPQQIILGPAALKNMLKGNTQVGQQTGQRMMLTTAGTQPGQIGQLMAQQIIVPANFQGNTLNIKTLQGLQGLKMIPIQQGTSNDRVFARLLTTKPQTATATPTNSTSTPTSTITSAEKE